MSKILDWLDALLIRDSFQREVRRWFRDKGDSTLRLDYPLNADSIVLDVGDTKEIFPLSFMKNLIAESSFLNRFQPSTAFVRNGLPATQRLLP